VSLETCQRGRTNRRWTSRPKGPAHRRNQQGRPDEMAGLPQLRQTLASRDRHRAIQVHHRAASASPVASCPANRGRHRLRRSQPNACVRTPEIRPPQGSYGIVMALQRSAAAQRRIHAPTPPSSNSSSPRAANVSIAPRSLNCLDDAAECATLSNRRGPFARRRPVSSGE
jgi:hypothetical protein